MHRMIDYVQLVAIVHFFFFFDFPSLVGSNVIYKEFHTLKWFLKGKLMAVYNHMNAYFMYGCTTSMFCKT